MSSDEAYYESVKQLKDKKGKRKICSLSRQSSDKLQFHERLDFKFYDFQALEIEEGWNNLFVSIVSMETGETIAKSGKASVQNGQCYWEDSMLSTIWIADDHSLQDHEGCILKLIVAMGSARFGTLGETTINLGSYIRPDISTASLPLKQHCSHGTILQVKIQCLTPRSKHRKDSSSYMEEMSVGYDDVDSISDLSDNTFSRTSGSSLCDQLENAYYDGTLSSKRISSLATYSDHGVDSFESSFSFWIEKFPQQSTGSGLKKNMNRSYDTSGSICSSSMTSSSRTQLQDKIEDLEKASHANDTTLTRSLSSSKDLMGVAQVTIELLHGEAKMWEESARKLMIGMERLRKHLNKKSKKKKDLEMELSASRKECSALKEELQRLTTMAKHDDSRNLEFQVEEMDNSIKELKDEIKYQKGLNCDLELKLKKTQKSNIDLVSILQKLEEIIKRQKMEIADLSMKSSKFQDVEISSHALDDSEEEDFSLSKEASPEKMRKEFCNSDVDLSTNGSAIRCLHEGIELREFRNLELEHQLMQEKQKQLESTIKFLEKTVEEKDQKLHSVRRCMAQAIEENEEKWRNKLFEKKLSDGVSASSNEILAMTESVQNLEAEFFEKQGESRKDLVISDSFSSNFLMFDSNTAIKSIKVFLELHKQLQLSVEDLSGQDCLLSQVTFTRNENCFSISELSNDAGKINLKELTEAVMCAIMLLKKLLETKATCFEYEINSHDELAKGRIRDDNVFQNDMEFHDWRKDSPTLVNKEDIRNLSGLENSDDGRNAFFRLEAENVMLSERIFSLEAEMRHLIEEKELVLENSENAIINLQVEIERMQTSNEAQKVKLKREEESMQKKLIEAQEECSILKITNLELQATNENLIEESKTLQTTNEELIIQNLEFDCQCTVLESKLGESQIAFYDMVKLVEDLEYKITSLIGEIALKEKTINVELDALLQEIKKQDERFIMKEAYLTQMHLEKTAEADDLQREVEHLRDRISGICDQHTSMASNIILEVFDLYADKAMLEASLQEEQQKVKRYETKLDNLQAEYEVMVQNYTEELAAAATNQEILMVNHEKVLVILETIKSNEEKLKGTVTGLEEELKASEIERLQAIEDISELEVQLQKTAMLQDEIFILKRSLYEAEFACRRLEASYQMLSLECDELKAKQISCIQRISMTEKISSDLEDCMRSKIELEEKISQLQWDLTTKEASCSSNAQLKYELAHMTKENRELQRKKDSLQQENEDYKNKVIGLEEKLKQKKDSKQDQYNGRDFSTFTTSSLHDLKFLQEEDN